MVDITELLRNAPIKILLATILVAYFTSAENILAIIPTPSFSHQIAFRPLWKALANKGHNITLVTTDPMEEANLENIKQINMSFAYEYFEKHHVVDLFSDDSKSFAVKVEAIGRAVNETLVTFFQNREGQNLIHNKQNLFHLLIVETQMPAMMIFSWWFRIPFIVVRSMDCDLQFHLTAGNLVHPAIAPDPNFALMDIKATTFWERIMSFTYITIIKVVTQLLFYPSEEKRLQIFFGKAVPPISEIQDNMSMLFISTNPIFQATRALMPNTITIGNGIHLGRGGQLTEDVFRFLDEAREGAIYFSLGSNVKWHHLNDFTKKEIVAAFFNLPYKVIWKIDYEFDKLPSNVIAKKWFASQEAILGHPNVKLFITQGGLQSMQESVYFAKPMIGIPFSGDQHMNVRRMAQLGYGIKVDKNNITQQSIIEAVLEVMNNPLYEEKARQYSEIFRDVEMPNVDKAVWWTEYVIRHKGARHLRNPTLDMPFWKENMIDIFGFFIALIGLCFFGLRWLIRFGRCDRRRKTTNVKQAKKFS